MTKHSHSTPSLPHKFGADRHAARRRHHEAESAREAREGDYRRGEYKDGDRRTCARLFDDSGMLEDWFGPEDLLR